MGQYLELVFDRPKDGLPVQITDVEDLGSSRIVTATAGSNTLTVRLDEDVDVRGDGGWLVFPRRRSLLFRNSRLLRDENAGRG